MFYVYDVRVLTIITVVYALILRWRVREWLEELRWQCHSSVERRLKETRPYLFDTVVFFPEVFELGDAEANKTKAKWPFGLKELFASFIKFGFCFDPAIE